MSLACSRVVDNTPVWSGESWLILHFSFASTYGYMKVIVSLGQSLSLFFFHCSHRGSDRRIYLGGMYTQVHWPLRRVRAGFCSGGACPSLSRSLNRGIYSNEEKKSNQRATLRISRLGTVGGWMSRQNLCIKPEQSLDPAAEADNPLHKGKQRNYLMLFHLVLCIPTFQRLPLGLYYPCCENA